MAYNIIRLKDMYDAIGEQETQKILKQYECPLNEDVEFFLRQKAIEFLKMDISQTFLIYSTYKSQNVLVGYFAITNKTTKIKKEALSKSFRKKISRFARQSEIDNDSLEMALPLIGQLGKNYKNGYNNLITGDVLLKLACNKVKEATDILGGKFVFIECEDKQKLRKFYEDNGFVCFGKRELEKDEKIPDNDGYLLQMLCDLKKIAE